MKADMNKGVKIERVTEDMPENLGIYQLDPEGDYIPFVFDNKRHFLTWSKEQRERQRLREEMERERARSDAFEAWYRAGGFDLFRSVERIA